VTDHAYIPRFVKRGSDFVGGYGYQMNYVSRRVAHPAKFVSGFGPGYKNRVRNLLPGLFQMGGYGKVEHRPQNRVTVDPTRADPYGIPIPVVQFEFGANDRALFSDIVASAHRIFDACGAEMRQFQTPNIGGFASHEVGTVRMGRNPKTSVLNEWNQSREVRNLFVVDGSCFTTFPEKNPTLTIAALAVRCARQIAAMRRRGDL